MSVFSDLRAALVADLVEVLGVPVHGAWPDVVTAPCAFVAPPVADDWIRRGEMFGGEFIAYLELVVIVEHGDATTSLVALEDLVQIALTYTADWLLSGVDGPAPITVTEGGAEYLASIIHLGKTVRM